MGQGQSQQQAAQQPPELQLSEEERVQLQAEVTLLFVQSVLQR